MPIVKLNMIKGRNSGEKRAVVDGIHKSLVEAFKIPLDDINYRIIEFDKENYILSPGKTDKYILIEIAIFPGRSIDAKRVLYKRIVENLQVLEIEASDIFILLQEEPLDNWGIRGGYPASEINLGFNLKV